jgi:hypothetical protein
LNTEICIIERMKTTLDIDDKLLAEAKARAAVERSSLTRLIEEGLALRLRAKRQGAARTPISLPVFHGGGLRPGIDGTRNGSMLDAADADA